MERLDPTDHQEILRPATNQCQETRDSQETQALRDLPEAQETQDATANQELRVQGVHQDNLEIPALVARTVPRVRPAHRVPKETAASVRSTALWMEACFSKMALAAKRASDDESV
jgi:hypothetical protein